ncbi:7-carboxy-7-deazaguanine synthase [Halorhodospira abdelmalekii]|uniref:7-carboxy-7-deazaguanine synthase n=1 Tax=Halorhodospira abdelmalekii TaxID=421629 RepID=UPI001903850A|nr:7-carboxy-7-deazaguanine synthase [Halorhodospira abdelmalekii]MBK1733744.1 7-carboxy-7-deazaguanine synthase [Halorhodospira abdelmalekii]
MYAVHSLFYSLQGEGAWSGRPALFLRFSGCNLWSGREADRTSAQCRFCDTDFISRNAPGGGRYTSAEALATAVTQLWPREDSAPYVVCTGGEPALQLDPPLIEALQARGATIAIETNGTLALPPGIDWVCVSPKAGTDLVVTSGDELKLVYPQAGLDPQSYLHLPFRHFFLQPLDDLDDSACASHTAAAITYCLRHPRWSLSVQLHKRLGIE